MYCTFVSYLRVKRTNIKCAEKIVLSGQRNLGFSQTCPQHKVPELHQDMFTLQWLLMHLDGSTTKGPELHLDVYTEAWAVPGRVSIKGT
jgi:hypothetical protein